MPAGPLVLSKNIYSLRSKFGLSELHASMAYGSLYEFFRLSWKELEPTQTLVENWHLEAICDHVQGSLEDWIKVQKWQAAKEKAKQERKRFDKERPVIRAQNQIFNVPPGSSKSRILSVCAPAWMWLHWPSWRSMFLSANPRVALRDSMLCRQLIESDWYQNAFAPDWELRDDQNAKSLYWTTKNGFRLSNGIFAKMIGDRVDCIGTDDPHDPEEVKVDENRDKVCSRFDQAINNRVSDLEISLRWLIMQRLAQLDLSGHLLAKNGWRLFCLPMEYEPHRYKANPDYSKNEIPLTTWLDVDGGKKWHDPRTKVGELLDEVRFPAHVLADERESLGELGYAGQMQQRPAPLEGGIWKRRWWGYWTIEGIDLPPVQVPLADGSFHTCHQKVLPARLEVLLQSWDMAFGKSEGSSMVVGQVWGLEKYDRFFLDQRRDQMDFVETKAAVQAMSEDWPDAETKLIENKANGPAVISSLKGEISGILPIEPDGDKVARALAEQGTIESGHVFLPHPGLFKPEIILRLRASHPHIAAMLQRALDTSAAKASKSKKKAASTVPNYVVGFVDECTNFPRGAFKDVVDTASQALNRLRKHIRLRDSHTDDDEGDSSSGWVNGN